MSQSNSLVSLPSQVLPQLAKLGQRVRAQRINAQWTIAETAQRLLCSPTTYRALEAGKPTVSLGLLVNALWLFGQLESLGAVCPMPVESFVKRRVRKGRTVAGNIEERERDF